MNDLLNPYIAGAPIVEVDMFFGRKDVFGWIERSLMGRYIDHILVIHGQRRVGKTSILKQIPNHLPERYIQVFFDLQGRTNSTLERLLWWLAREITRTLNREHGLFLSAPDRVSFDADPEILFTHFLPEVQVALGEQVLLLTFDEFDTLQRPNIQESLALPAIQALRRMMELEGISFIFSIGSSGQKLENMQATYTDFFKYALYKKISFLEQADCNELITKPVEGVLDYAPSAVRRIYEVTAGHPYFTQLVCHELFSMCQQTGVRDIHRADVDAVLGSVIERGTVNLKFVWDEADDLEKWMLACLARTSDCSDLSMLTKTLHDLHVRYSDADLAAALMHMREKDVLTENNQFVIELLRLWLRQNRPLERVREELVEVSPIANRYIEIGEEYWEQGQRESALQSFQQALEVDPRNVKARVSVGTLLLEAGELEAAAVAFKNALSLDSENVTAIGGYCKAQLARGDQSRHEGDINLAMGYYREVLEVNPEHPAARERLATIYRTQAEAKLDIGQDEVALLAFKTALEFTPDDEDLVARVDQAMADKRANAVSTLTNRAEDAQANGDWEAAIAALQDALKIIGEDVVLEKKLALAKAGKRAHLLASLPEQARDFEAQETWGEAIRVWDTYLTLYPEDQGKAEEALENARKMAAIQDKYVKAQKALERKNHQQAIELLQQVVHADPGYKDSSQLLATAVGASREKQVSFLRRSWYALPLAFVLITIATYFSLREEIQLPATVLLRATATATSTPPTATPEWVTDFAEPLLAEIEDKPPSFEDDFSSFKQEWLTIDEGAQYEEIPWIDGALHLRGNEPYLHLEMDTKDFIAQLQFKPVKLSGGKFYIFLNDSHFINFDLGESEEYEIVPSSSMSDAWYSPNNNTWPGTRAPRELTLILKDGKLAIYLDRQPLNAAANFSIEEIDFNLGVSYGDSTVEVDNFRYWDLSTVESKPITDIIPHGTTESDSQEITTRDQEFFQELLDDVAARPPDIVDDYSTPLSWQNQYGVRVEQTGVYQGGRYHLYATKEKLQQKLPLLAKDFALELDILPGEFSGEDSGFALTLRGDSRGNHYRFEIDPSASEYRFTRSLSTGHESILSEGELPETSQSVPSNLKTLAYGEQMAFYLEDELLVKVSDDSLEGAENGISLSALTGYASISIDNLKLWDLNPEPVPSWVNEFALPILNSIRDRTPDFKDDFTTPDESWLLHQHIGGVLYGGTVEETYKQVQISDYIIEGTLKFDIDNGVSYHLTHDAMHTPDFVLKYDITPKSGGSFWSRFTREETYSFTYNPGSRSWLAGDTDDEKKYGQGENPDFGNKPTQMLIMVHGDLFIVYLNGKPLTYFQFSPSSETYNNFVFSNHGSLARVTFDNINFWKLETEAISRETDICTVKWPISVKVSEPDPDASTNRWGAIPVGTHIRVIGSATGTDGNTWYDIGYDSPEGSGLGGWVPASALSEACLQEIPTE